MRLMLERNRFELHFGIINKTDVDMWGCAYCIMDDYGAEYNLCIEDGKDNSAIYLMRRDLSGNWDTDGSRFIPYKVTFGKGWKKELRKAMEKFIIENADFEQESDKLTISHYLSHFKDYSENDDICLKRHRKRYNLTDPIIAYYRTWDDFVEDWCDNTGFTNSEARKMLHGGKGEFKQLPNGHGIVRFLV